MSYLYGDSTPFPYDVDYIDLCRHAVDCALQLLSAQHAIGSALTREEAHSQQRNLERGRLSAMSEAVERALGPFLNSDSEPTAQAALRTLQSAKACLEEQRGQGERLATDAASHAQHVIQRAGESAHRALEAFLTRQDLPETELGLRLECGSEGYSGEVSIRTPFGVSATFAMRISAESPWGRVRRVGDVLGNLEIHVPQQAGWLSRRVEMAPVKLEKMVISSVRVAGTELELVFRKSANGGPGYRASVELRGTRGVLLSPVDENGSANGEPPLTLDGEDGTRMVELAHRVLDSLQGLSGSRGSMRSISLDERPLEQLEWPETVAHRLLAQLAPVAMEIARRSGAPGELVLRRDVGDGRREEIYVTKADLWERLLVLPPERRIPFAALGLSPPLAASPAAPSLAAPSLAEPPPSSVPSSLDPSLPLFELPAIAAAVSASSVA
ncbi:MAG: hypothetical protein RL685_7258 [Pseudomonadota bacterium]|jgi:hypothetical protein